ncbi:MAG: CvpA family protein [Clostridia bacterium]|nr:CvpA family protein [Clostridia bacterium]
MQFIWDLIFVGIIAAFVFFAYKKGLIATIFNLLGTVIAFVGALILKDAVGAWIDTAFVRSPIRNMVLSTLTDSPVLKYEEALAEIDIAEKIHQMPEALKRLLESVGLSPESFTSGISSATSADAKNELIDRIALPISATISTAIAFVVLFVVLLVVCFVAAKLLSALCNLLPVGKTLNRVGGGIIGFAEGVLVVLILSAVVWAICAGADEGFFSRTALEDTVVTKFIIENNPICKLFG